MFNMPRDSREAGPGGRGGGEEDVGGDDDEFSGLSEQPYDDQHEGDNDAEALEEGGVVGQQGEERLQQPSGSGEPATSGAKEQPADADEDGDADAEVLKDIASWAERDVGTEESFSESNDYMQWEEAADHFLLDESDWNDAMGNDDDDDAGDDDDPAAGTPAPAPEAEKVQPQVKQPNMMDILCQKVQERLQLELSPKKKSMVSDRWLLRLLAQNSFWIRAGHIIVRNGVLRRQDGVRSPRAMTFDAVRPVPEVFYYRDLFVWLPDLMFATTLSTRTLLTCPSCSSSYDNKVHGYLKARRSHSPTDVRRCRRRLLQHDQSESELAVRDAQPKRHRHKNLHHDRQLSTATTSCEPDPGAWRPTAPVYSPTVSPKRPLPTHDAEQLDRHERERRRLFEYHAQLRPGNNDLFLNLPTSRTRSGSSQNTE
ncbi:hypothetical protein AB1Y20_023620 [Prymnesium parvum]|uniref:Uncharacterized protein n=1 Tax=Prymnesium parvum TaxID=97485 RepID=A0AB34JHL7_PRYPA